MSVELTGKAIDILTIKPQKDRVNDHQPVKDLVALGLSVENNLTRLKTSEETQNAYQLNKKKVEAEKEIMTVPQLEKVAKQLQEFIGTMNRGLEFSVDEDSGRDVIKVVDKKSGELIKQYPSEEVLSLVSKLSEATGAFIDSKI
jgi:flagellar protein FlaG